MIQQASWVPDGVFIVGGWGCPSDWMTPLADDLSEALECPAEVIDLPSYQHGEAAENESAEQSSYSDALAQWYKRIAKKVAACESPLLVGWSYGGMLAVSLAHRLIWNEAVNVKVVTLAARPRFISDLWTEFDTEVAHAFSSRVLASQQKGLTYFVALNGQGVEKSVLSALKQSIKTIGVSKVALLASLDHLFELDVSLSWQFLEQYERLESIYFDHDALINVPEGTDQDHLLSGNHLLPVVHSTELSKRIKGLLFG